MSNQLLFALLILVPLLGAFLLPLAGLISARLRSILALVFVLVPLGAAVCALIPLVNGGEPYTLSIPLTVYTMNMSLGLLADRLAVFMALISTFVGSVIVVYSFGYMRHSQNQNEYYMLVVLFIGAMMGIVFSTNLIFLYLFWEISAIVCWRLIGFFRNREYILRADKAFLITVFGALVMLLGFIMIYQQTGSWDLTVIKSKGVDLTNITVLLLLFGILSKSATLPLHTWLPDAGVAPSPVTALLHAAILVKIGVYVFARIFIINIPLPEVWHTALPVIAAVSALVSAGAAMIETNIKRIIAYSTISQLGFILLGLAVGSPMAAVGGLLYILMHSIAKGGLFLCAGIIEHNAHTKDITKMGGMFHKMPVTAVSFLLCALSVMGIPPLGGFFSKYMVLSGAVNAGHPWIALVFMIGAIMTVIYLLRVFIMVFFGEEKMPAVKEGSKLMLTSVVVLAVFSVLSGLLINFPSQFVEVLVNQAGVMLK